MNTNPDAIRVLCYGDSITYGRISNSNERFNAAQRRTGVLQNQLGNGYEIIEEGLRSRYTNLDNESFPGRNGYDYFYPAVLSHLPLDILVLSLGTNNLQHKFYETAESIINSLGSYFDLLTKACESFEMSVPKVILISPPYIDSSVLKLNSIFDARSGEESRKFIDYYKKLADKYGCELIDAGAIIGVGVIDGVHLSLEQNETLGKHVAEKIAGMSDGA